MEQYPHHYVVDGASASSGSVSLRSEGLDDIPAAPPAQFGGPGDQWSPETLFVAAVVSCFSLTFRAIARASGLEWEWLECSADGVLDRDGRELRFTAIRLRAELRLPAGGDANKARSLLERSESKCLVTASLSTPVELEPVVHVAD